MRLRVKLKKLHREGEISVYLCLVFVVVISLFVSVITAARGAALQAVFECALESALCSAFGEYDRELLDRYDVLFIDLSYLSNSPDPENLEARIQTYLEDNLLPEKGTKLLFASDFADVSGTNVELEKYTLATDYYGQAFRKQAIDYIKDFVMVKDIENIQNLITVSDTYKLTEFDIEKESEQIKLKCAKKGETWQQTDFENSLLDRLDNIDFKIPDSIGKLSLATIDITDTVSFRNKENGNYALPDFELDITNDIFFDEYIMAEFGNFIDRKEDTKLAYETEYILAGYPSDAVNLTAVAGSIFAIRTAANLYTLHSSEEIKTTVEAAAQIVGALIKIPPEAASELIMFLWAVAEATTDVTQILEGKKIPVVKGEGDLNVSLQGIIPFITSQAELVDNESAVAYSDDGIPIVEAGYTDYLRLFLIMLPVFQRTVRTMDMIEQDLRYCGSGENIFFRFDACTDSIRVTVSMESAFDFRFITTKEYSFF